MLITTQARVRVINLGGMADAVIYPRERAKSVRKRIYQPMGLKNYLR